MVRSRSRLSWGFLICSRELSSQGSGVGCAETKGVVLRVCNVSNLLPAGIQTALPGKSPYGMLVSVGLSWFVLCHCLLRSASSYRAGLTELAVCRCPTRDSGGICRGGICPAVKPGISYSSQPFRGEKQVGLGESPSPLQIK